MVFQIIYLYNIDTMFIVEPSFRKINILKCFIRFIEPEKEDRKVAHVFKNEAPRTLK